MKDEHIWHSGPPPHIGWWNASRKRLSISWRWWNGESWSVACAPDTPIDRVIHMATLPGSLAGPVEWTYYWPENARVPRIVPTMDIETYKVGDAVRITEAHIKKMKASNRSSATPGYPSDSFISKAREVVGIPGQVTHTFPPGHNYSVRFDLSPGISISLHMKESWFTRA